MPETLDGLVIARAPGYFIVRSDDGAIRLCTLRGKLLRARQRPPPRHAASLATHGTPSSTRSSAPAIEQPENANMVAVGDRVRLTPDSTTGGAIESVLPRRNKLSRGSAETHNEQILLANLDLAVLVLAAQDPLPHFGLLDRYLVLAEAGQVPVVICLNKIDLGVPESVGEMMALYERLGYPVIRTSLIWQAGLAELRQHLAGQTTLLTGPSGVGKSSLLNHLEPEAAQRVGEISAATHKGRHTTTGVRLFPLNAGGWLADSAGIRELALWNVPQADLPQAFIEFRPYLGTCAYDDCTHTPGEEGCAIQEAVEAGIIHPNRYASYLRLLEELEDASSLARS